MNIIKIILIIDIFLLAGCSTTPPLISKQNKVFQKGYSDGCTTANGTYMKNHKLFNNYIDYANGWFQGRKECRK